MEQIVKGSKIAVLITLSGLPTSMEFSDDDVDMTFSFFVNGKRSQKELVVKKDELVKSVDSNKVFYAILDTTDFPTGNVICEGKVTYPYNIVGKSLVDKPTFDCGITIIENM